LTGVAAGACPAPNDVSFRPLAVLWQTTWRAADAAPGERPPDGSTAGADDAAVPVRARSRREWVMEGLSFLTISRPALDLLQPVWREETPLSLRSVALIDAAHLAAVLTAAAAVLSGGFIWRERRWLEQV